MVTTYCAHLSYQYGNYLLAHLSAVTHIYPSILSVQESHTIIAHVCWRSLSLSSILLIFVDLIFYNYVYTTINNWCVLCNLRCRSYCNWSPEQNIRWSTDFIHLPNFRGKGLKTLIVEIWGTHKRDSVI